jgi:hypothetical protein
VSNIIVTFCYYVMEELNRMLTMDTGLWLVNIPHFPALCRLVKKCQHICNNKSKNLYCYWTNFLHLKGGISYLIAVLLILREITKTFSRECSFNESLCSKRLQQIFLFYSWTFMILFGTALRLSFAVIDLSKRVSVSTWTWNWFSALNRMR